jgi:uncharacterized protein
MKPTVILMLKEPVPGNVKTRLARDVGEQEACRVYRTLVELQLRFIPKGWEVEICFSPASALPVMKEWLGQSYQYHPQVEGDLGMRMAAAVLRQQPSAQRPVILVGGDCPYLSDVVLEECATLLNRHQVVIGPSLDGGYYLLGLQSYVADFFQEMPWSTESVFSETMRRAERQGLCPALLPVLEDVDDKAGWERAQKNGVA